MSQLQEDAQARCDEMPRVRRPHTFDQEDTDRGSLGVNPRRRSDHRVCVLSEGGSIPPAPDGGRGVSRRVQCINRSQHHSFIQQGHGQDRRSSLRSQSPRSCQGTFSWSGYTMDVDPGSGSPRRRVLHRDDREFRKGRSTDEPLDCGSYSWSFSTADLPTVRRSIGTGAGDFWTVYPTIHPSSGRTVTHPDWVIAALEQEVVMILDHSEGCYPCIQQTSDMRIRLRHLPGTAVLRPLLRDRRA